MHDTSSKPGINAGAVSHLLSVVDQLDISSTEMAALTQHCYMVRAGTYETWCAHGTVCMARASNDDAPQPRIGKPQVVAAVNAGLTPVLVLDDVDRIGTTSSRVLKFADLVKLYADAGGQIIATSTSSPEQLTELWKAVPHADAIALRLVGSGKVIEFGG